MKIAIVSIFPEMFESLQVGGVVGRAIKKGIIELSFWNPRDYAEDERRTVDDRPYGGGPGMLMLAEPLYQSIMAAKAALGETAPVYYLSPQGETFSQKQAETLAETEAMILVSGRYEGIDQRVIDTCVDSEISIGSYVLSGGELPAMVLIDAVSRLIPGVLGHEDSAKEDSFSNGQLDCPHYSRPEVWRDQAVPEILLSGHHKKIAEWRREMGKRS